MNTTFEIRDLIKTDNLEKLLEDFTLILSQIYQKDPMGLMTKFSELNKLKLGITLSSEPKNEEIEIKFENRIFSITSSEIYSLLKEMDDINHSALSGSYVRVLMDN